MGKFYIAGKLPGTDIVGLFTDGDLCINYKTTPDQDVLDRINKDMPTISRIVGGLYYLELTDEQEQRYNVLCQILPQENTGLFVSEDDIDRVRASHDEIEEALAELFFQVFLDKLLGE